MVEQVTVNHLVGSSNLSRGANLENQRTLVFLYWQHGQMRTADVIFKVQFAESAGLQIRTSRCNATASPKGEGPWMARVIRSPASKNQIAPQGLFGFLHFGEG